MKNRGLKGYLSMGAVILFLLLFLLRGSIDGQKTVGMGEVLARRIMEEAAHPAEETAIRYDSFGEEVLNQHPYIQAYSDYIRSIGPECGEEFPVRGYYLLDLNFDSVPELGVFHDSLGSMGGYFCYYRFDGKKVVPLLTENNQPLQISAYTQILADFERKEVYLLKEMYLLWGNNNGQTGYVSKLKEVDGIFYEHNYLDLHIDWEKNPNYELKNYSTEDEYLSDSMIDEYLITREWEDGRWKEISSADYLAKKRELMPKERFYMDLRNTAACILGEREDCYGSDGMSYQNWLAQEEELDQLFGKWLELIQPVTDMEADLSSWMGMYEYSDTAPHMAEEAVSYVRQHTLYIYQRDDGCYAYIEGVGQQLHSCLIAHVTGDDEKIQLRFMTDKSPNIYADYQYVQPNYQKGELLLELTRVDGRLETAWHALWQETFFTKEEYEEGIQGEYFRLIRGRIYSPTSKEAFLAKITQETSEPVCDIFYEDYEGNGEYSAFVFTGMKEGEGEGTSFLGSLWYVNREGCKLLEEKIETSRYKPTILIWGNEKHLLFVQSDLLNSAFSYFWRIEKNVPLMTEKLPYYTYQQGDDLIMVNSFIERTIGERIWQRYYIYWDEEEKCYQEYIGKEISEEEFLSYKNAGQLQREIENDLIESNFRNKEIDAIYKQYILRENGIINVQFQFKRKVDTAYSYDYYYAVLRVEEGNKVVKDEYFCYDVDEEGYIQEQGIFELQSRPKRQAGEDGQAAR